MWSPTHVQITVCRARSLKIKGKAGTNDAFVMIKLGKDRYQTSVCERSKDPEWLEQCDFALNKKCTVVKLKAFHRNLFGLDDFLGQVELDLSEFKVHERARAIWYPLLSKPGSKNPKEKRGELQIVVSFQVQSLSSSQLTLSRSTGKAGFKGLSSLRGLGDSLSSQMPSKAGSRFSLRSNHSSNEADRIRPRMLPSWYNNNNNKDDDSSSIQSEDKPTGRVLNSDDDEDDDDRNHTSAYDLKAATVDTPVSKPKNKLLLRTSHLSQSSFDLLPRSSSVMTQSSVSPVHEETKEACTDVENSDAKFPFDVSFAQLATSQPETFNSQPSPSTDIQVGGRLDDTQSRESDGYNKPSVRTTVDRDTPVETDRQMLSATQQDATNARLNLTLDFTSDKRKNTYHSSSSISKQTNLSHSEQKSSSETAVNHIQKPVSFTEGSHVLSVTNCDISLSAPSVTTDVPVTSIWMSSPVLGDMMTHRLSDVQEELLSTDMQSVLKGISENNLSDVSAASADELQQTESTDAYQSVRKPTVCDQQTQTPQSTSTPSYQWPVSPAAICEYSSLSREDLLQLVVHQRQQLRERDSHVADLERYIDNLLVKVIDLQPLLLCSPCDNASTPHQSTCSGSIRQTSAQFGRQMPPPKPSRAVSMPSGHASSPSSLFTLRSIQALLK